MWTSGNIKELPQVKNLRQSVCMDLNGDEGNRTPVRNLVHRTSTSVAGLFGFPWLHTGRRVCSFGSFMIRIHRQSLLWTVSRIRWCPGPRVRVPPVGQATAIKQPLLIRNYLLYQRLYLRVEFDVSRTARFSDFENPVETSTSPLRDPVTKEEHLSFRMIRPATLYTDPHL